MATNTAEQLTPAAAPSPYREALEAAKAIRLPEHVRQAYEWNELKDVFLERRAGGRYPEKLGGGPFRRMWFAATDAAREQLPPNPESYPKLPDQFRNPSVRKRLSQQQHTEHRRSWERERFAQESRKPVLVP